MILIETHIIKKSNKYYFEADHLCFLSKNLYNASNYVVRQEYFKNKTYLDYNHLNKLFTDTDQFDYRSLPAKVSKGTQRKLHSNWLSYFAAKKEYFKHPDKYKSAPKLPKYLKKTGRFMVHYEKGALSFKRKGYINLSKTDIYIKTSLTKETVSYVDIIPEYNCIKFLIGYKVAEPEIKPNNNRYASIDLGVNNLAVITSNVMKPVIFNGRPLKSINQYANKKLVEYKSVMDKAADEGDIITKLYYQDKIDRLWLKRNNKIKDYLHKTSTLLVNHLVSNNISVLIIGKNKYWKQDSNIGKQGNQNFVSIPFNMFVDMVSYKCALQGIYVDFVDESYTSKSSFLDMDMIPTYKRNCKANYVFSGKRIKRGLYVSGNGTKINADVNGSLNILRKYLTAKVAWNNQSWFDCVERCSNETILKVNVA